MDLWLRRVGRINSSQYIQRDGTPAYTEADLRLARFVETAHGFPGVEDVLAGRGLERLYAFVRSESGQPGEKTASDIMADMAAGEALAEETGRLYVRLMGSELGNLALTHLPFGGIFLIGGVARAFQPFFTRFDFAGAFRDKGRFAGFMANFAVTIIEDDYAALTGCAVYLAQGGKG